MTLDRSTLFIGGEWVEPAGAEPRSRSSRRTPKRSSAGRRGTAADIDRAVAAARRGLRRRPVAAARRRTASRSCQARRPLRRPDGRDRRRDHRRDGLADLLLPAGPGPRTVDDARAPSPTSARTFPVGGRRGRARWAGRDRAPRAGRRRRRRSCRGTCRSSRDLPSSRRRCSPAARSCSSRAPETPLDAYLLAELLDEAGLPAGRGQHRARPGVRSASTSSRHPGVDKVAFTGSTAAGRAHRRSICGEQLKRVQPGAGRQVGGDHPRRRRPRPRRWSG